MIELALLVPVFNQQHVAFTTHVRKGGRSVVLSQPIVGDVVGAELGLVGVKIRLLDFFGDAEHAFARWHVDLLGDDRFAALGRFAIDGQLARDGLLAAFGSIVAQHHSHFKRLTFARVGRYVNLFDRDFVTRGEHHRHHVETDACSGHCFGFTLRVAQILIAVGHQHDPFGRVERKHRLRALDGHRQIGVFGVENRLNVRIERDANFDQRHFHGRVTTEDDHRIAIFFRRVTVLRDRRIDILDHLLPLLDRNTQRLIEQIDDRKFVAPLLVLDVG